MEATGGAMTLPFTTNLSGVAAATAVLIIAGAHVIAVGLRCMAQRTLPLAHRRTIGRYMLLGVTLLLVVGAVIAAGSLRGGLRETPQPSTTQSTSP